jgi:hypothetical protein
MTLGSDGSLDLSTLHGRQRTAASEIRAISRGHDDQDEWLDLDVGSVRRRVAFRRAFDLVPRLVVMNPSIVLIDVPTIPEPLDHNE